jgi:uncharacterized protein with beta-barrel porin domain
VTVFSSARLNAGAGRSVTLMGAQVLNEGAITALGGSINLISAQTVQLGVDANGLVSVAGGLTAAADASIVNSGVLDATGGTLSLHASAVAGGDIVNNGVIRAGLLTGSATGSATFGGLTTIAALGSFTTGGDFTLTNSQAMAIVGSGVSAGGNLSIETTVGGINVDANITGNDVALRAAGDLAINRTVTGASVSLAATGNIVVDGTVVGPITALSTPRLIVGSSAAHSSAQVQSALTIGSGMTLGGHGSVGATTVLAGGTLSPGNSIGTLTVQGNLAFASGSTYLVEVDANGSDRTNVAGTATLGGATVQAIYAPGSYVNRQHTILNATGGRSGTFSTLVNTNLPPSFTPSLSYDAQNVYLSLTLNFAPPTPGSSNPPAFGGLSGNQQNVANALVTSFNTAGGIPLVLGALSASGLTQVAGETAIGVQQTTLDAMDRFTNLLTDPFVSGRTGAPAQASGSPYASDGDASAFAPTRGQGGHGRTTGAYAALANASYSKAPVRTAIFEPRWTLWAAGYGGTQTTQGDAAAGSTTTTSRIHGGAVGAQYRFSPDTLIGFAWGGAGTDYHLANGLGGGSSELFQAGFYGRHDIGRTYLAAALAYGWQDVTTERTVLGLDRLRARFDANALSGRLEGGYRFAIPWIGVTPYAAGQLTTFFLPDYAEQALAGVNTFALSYASKTVTAPRSELGVRTDKSFALNDALLTLRGRAAWVHNFITDRSISAIFQTLPASGFVVNGAAPAHDAALVSAGAEISWRNGFSVAGTFEGEFSNITESYAGKGIVRYQW